MTPHSMTPDEIDAYRREYPKDRYSIRHVNGEHGQHWAVSNQLWNTLSLSYTESEAYAILALFQKRLPRRKRGV